MYRFPSNLTAAWSSEKIFKQFQALLKIFMMNQFVLALELDQWFSNIFNISALRSPKIFFYHSWFFILKHKFPRKHAKSSEVQKKNVIVSANVQSSTI